MSKIQNGIEDSIRFPFKNWKMILVIGTLIFVISITNKMPFPKAMEHLIALAFSNILIFMVVGYGSMIVFTGLKGMNKPPMLIKFPKLIWEGIKKSAILFFYSIILSYLISHINNCLSLGNFPLAIIYMIISLFIYFLLIGGLLNRYENNGRFIKAFDFKEIFELFKKLGIADMISMAICGFIGHFVAINTLIDLDYYALSNEEILLSAVLFFIGPIALMATKRLIALNLRRIYSKE